MYATPPTDQPQPSTPNEGQLQGSTTTDKPGLMRLAPTPSLDGTVLEKKSTDDLSVEHVYICLVICQAGSLLFCPPSFYFCPPTSNPNYLFLLDVLSKQESFPARAGLVVTTSTLCKAHCL
ncbi:hypothetical protein CSKR_108548 [Clonorchis sinensis]|uniref:Uncharacterized protein n=1 Tax=Clonorchis sinensis TaxID=79923 RepID=A0A3R7GT22_CLOSI|nr:hypothetical protein CSKR_108548 [Clonorchis sinensis]